MSDPSFKIISTCPIGERHQNAIRQTSPNAELQTFNSISEAQDALAEAEILVTYGEDLTPEWLETCERLKWIQVISAGLDLIPFQAIAQRQIMLTNARGIHAVPMSEYVMGMILQIAHRFPQFYENQKARVWDRTIRLEEASGKTVGILGTGAIGAVIAEKAKGFGMRTLGMNTNGRLVPGIDEIVTREEMDQVLTESDYVIVIVPSTVDTKHMIGEKELAAMKQTAWLINIARGNVIDEQALLFALENERIGGAVLDVFDEEPLSEESPLWNAKNCLLTPHVSGRSPKYMERAMGIFLENLQVYCKGTGEYRNRIEPGKGY